MATLTLKDIPNPVHKALKARAKSRGRSLNKEAIECLQAAVLPQKVEVDQLLAEVREHRSSLPGKLNDRLLWEARNRGRP